MSKIDWDEVFGGLEKQKEARSSATEGIIRSMKKGTIRDFVQKENLSKFNKPDSVVINLMIETPDGYKVNRMLTLSSHPNSNLQRYLAKYKEYPKVGGKYPLEFQGGFWRPATL